MAFQFNYIVLLGTVTSGPFAQYTPKGAPYVTVYLLCKGVGELPARLKVTTFRAHLVEWASTSVQNGDLLIVGGHLTSWAMNDVLHFGVIAENIVRLTDKVLDQAQGEVPAESLV